MPTEAKITAARVAILDTPVNASTRDLAVAALTAAEKLRGQVSEEAATLLDLYEDTLAAGGGADEALITFPQGDLRHLLALARRGAGKAVPDEAAIRADERERCAQNSFMMIKDELAAKAKEDLAKEKARIVTYPPVKAPDFDEICERYKQHAAAPKPEDKT